MKGIEKTWLRELLAWLLELPFTRPLEETRASRTTIWFWTMVAMVTTMLIQAMIKKMLILKRAMGVKMLLLRIAISARQVPRQLMSS